MSHLWIQEPRSREWSVAALRGEAHAADSGRLVAGSERAAGDALLYDVGGVWVLIGSRAVRVNGEPLHGGVRVLRDRDELRVGSRRAFFCEHDPPVVVPFPGAERLIECPRCTRAMEPGEPAVRCICGLWHHQTRAYPCWGSFPRCSGCDSPTSLERGHRWSPEAL